MTWVRNKHNSTLAVFTWARITFRKTWLGSWFELRAFTCIVNAFPITISICALRGNSLLLLRSPRPLIDPCAYAWLQRAFLKCTRTNHVRKSFAFTCPRIRLSRRITIQNAPFFAFQNAFQKPIWKSFAFTWTKIQAFKTGKGRITFWNVFWNVILAHVNTANAVESVISR